MSSHRRRLVLASANPDKAAEIAAILGADGDLEIVPRPAHVPDVVEDGDTLEANARLKAVALCQATGAAAVADDTGLEVDALDGVPGVYSARFAGENATYQDNCRLLLTKLDGLPEAQRSARFRTVALVRFPNGHELMAEGVVEGRIAPSARGDGGFGYDPVFIPAPEEGGDGRAFAEMTSSEKHALSHRGRAFRALAAALREYGGLTNP